MHGKNSSSQYESQGRKHIVGAGSQSRKWDVAGKEMKTFILLMISFQSDANRAHDVETEAHKRRWTSRQMSLSLYPVFKIH